MSDKNNENQLDRLSPEELFDRFSDDSFSSLLEDDSVWGQNLPPDSPLNGGEGADDAWGRDGFGDSADPFGLTDISSAFGHLSSNTEETHTAEEAGKTVVETDSKVSDSGQYSAGADSRVSGPDLYPSQAEDTDITDESSLIRDSLHKDIPSEAETAAFEETLSSDEQVSEVRGSGIPLGCGGAPEYQESSDSTDAESVRARIQKKEESEKEEPEKEEPEKEEPEKEEPEKEEPEKEEPEKEELEKKRISRPIHILLALCILLAFLVLVLSSIPKKEIEVIEEEDKIGLFTEAVVSMYVADYYAVIDVSDIEGLIHAFLSSNKQWAAFYFGDRENFKGIGVDSEEIYLNVYIEDEIKNQKDFEAKAQELDETTDFPYFWYGEDWDEWNLESVEKDRRHFSWDICDVYYLAYGPTGELPGPEADYRQYYFWIQAPDRCEFRLEMFCGFSRIDKAFDPVKFLDDHIRIEEY